MNMPKAHEARVGGHHNVILQIVSLYMLVDNGIFYKKDDGKGQKSRRKRVKKSRRRKSRGQKY
jgi:hypothetical protein